MKRENTTSLMSGIIAFIAASCCIGPALFVLFGSSVGFFRGLKFLAPFRPYLLILAGLVLGFSFYKLYLKKQACNCVEEQRSKLISRIIFWFGTGLFVVSLTFEPLLSILA